MVETGWIPCGGEEGFIAADVIRFRDGVFERKGPKGRQSSTKIGALEITAQVIREFETRSGVYVALIVQACKVVEDKTGGRKVHPLKTGIEIRRLRASLVKWGWPERLPWTDESARERVVEDMNERSAAPLPKKREKRK
jgi:hypothetical protein